MGVPNANDNTIGGTPFKMKARIVSALFLIINQQVLCDEYIDVENYAFLNRTTPHDRQLYDFKMKHKKPIGLITTSSGMPVEVRDTAAVNMNQFKNQFHIDLMTNFANKKIPDRMVHAKGTGAWGYFVVNHDVSNYTSADVFNGIGKKTPLFARFSPAIQDQGGNDFDRGTRGVAIKLFTQEGNLDLLTLHIPVFFFRDPIIFDAFSKVIKRNPKTFRKEFTRYWDLITKRSEMLHSALWVESDYGIPNGYRKTDYFPIHTYELRNKHGDRYFAKFNFRTCQGVENIPTCEALRVKARDPDYFNRDLYDSIEEKNYPAWDLEMDIMPYADVLRCDYDPFDVTRLWRKGTYRTVPIGRVVLNENPDNFFRDVELSAFNPGNLVPGIPGPVDSLFRARFLAYRETQIHRLGINHNRIHVNTPLYRKEYNRDGLPPVLENMNDAPDYYPNSFNGPVPYVEEFRPRDSISVVHSKAADLEPAAYFYRNYMVTEGLRGRLINNTVDELLTIAPYMQKRVIRLYSLTDPDLGMRLARSLLIAEQDPGFAPPGVVLPKKRYVV